MLSLPFALSWLDHARGGNLPAAAELGPSLTQAQTDELWDATIATGVRIECPELYQALLALPLTTKFHLAKMASSSLANTFVIDRCIPVFEAFLSHPLVTEELVERLLTGNGRDVLWPSSPLGSDVLTQLCTQAGRFSQHLAWASCPRLPKAKLSTQVLPSKEFEIMVPQRLSIDEYLLQLLQRKEQERIDELDERRQFLCALEAELAGTPVSIRRAAAVLLDGWTGSVHELAEVACGLHA